MNQLISWLQNIRALFTVFFVVITLLMSTAFSNGNSLAAQAKPLTPEATSYQIDRTDTENTQEQDGIPNDQLIEKSQQKLKSAADNIREKLNLDQPIYPPTKEFLNTVQDKAQETVQGVQQTSDR
jgi:hypothetical protein